MRGEALTTGTEFAGHRIERLLGRGGMGAVYLATHLSLTDLRAIKVMVPPDDQEDYAALFAEEARMAARLRHPNIIRIHDFGEERGLLYIAMEYGEGDDLGKLLERGPLAPDRAVHLLAQAASALDFAHGKGVVHRDVKPANLIVTAYDHVYLTDFGIARRMGAPRQTRVGLFRGTVRYCAPEQISGEDVDRRADVYALGCVLYECLAGRPPFVRDDENTLALAHVVEPAPTLTSARPDLPAALDGVVKFALAKLPHARYPTCTALIDSARDALTTPRHPPTPPPPGPAVTQPSRGVRHPGGPPGGPFATINPPVGVTQPSGEFRPPPREPHSAEMIATPGHSMTAKANPKALASLIVSIVAAIAAIVPWLGVAVAAAGLVLGYRAKTEIDRSRGAQSGRGIALAGIVTGYAAVGIALIVFIINLAVAS